MHSPDAGKNRVHAGIDNPNEKWIDNEAHGGLFGIYMNKDGLPGCSHIRGFFVWRSFDYAIYFQVSQLNVHAHYFELRLTLSAGSFPNLSGGH